jgi:hypothetical protein
MSAYGRASSAAGQSQTLTARGQRSPDNEHGHPAKKKKQILRYAQDDTIPAR